MALEQIEGKVSRVIFRQPDGYAVLEVSAVGKLLPVTVVGTLSHVHPGEEIKVRGRLIKHPRFGEQFKVQHVESSPPSDNDGLVKYLCSGVFSGVGPELAQRLVAQFGTDLFDVIDHSPHRLKEVSGIGAKRAKLLAKRMLEERAVREVLVLLHGLEVGPSLARRILQAWGDKAMHRLRSDPYQLVEDIVGVGFVTADAIARRLGVAENSPSRLTAALLHLMQSANDLGDTVVNREVLVEKTAAFLETDVLAIEDTLKSLIGRNKVLARDTEDGEMVGLRSYVRAEENLALRLMKLTKQSSRSSAQSDSTLNEVQALISQDFTDDQRRAAWSAVVDPIVVITGGPGTGKTTVLRAAVSCLRRLNERIYLCAPTGRAAKRLTEATGQSAVTVHRLLGFKRGTFEYNHHNPLQPGTVILDEASMLDVLLARSLLRAFTEGCRLVLVGDTDQLPSVGPGNVLADVIKSHIANVVTLNTVFRQAAQSRIVTNAHNIRQGQLPMPSPSGIHGAGDFHIVDVEDPERAQQLLLEVCVQRIPKGYQLDPVRDVQVLSPMHRGAVGTIALNQLLQTALNPHGNVYKHGAVEFRVGDKVMQVRNDYDRDVFNGDVGWIDTINPTDHEMDVIINGVRVKYRSDQIDQLMLAYCMSIHKSQGSEYPAVVVPMLTQHFIMLQRNLLYTAVTRAKQLVVLVGSQRAIRIAVDRVDPSQRKTLLAHALKELRSGR